jgi:hypothetical protein
MNYSGKLRPRRMASAAAAKRVTRSHGAERPSPVVLPVARIVRDYGGGWLVITPRGHRWLDQQWRRS